MRRTVWQLIVGAALLLLLVVLGTLQYRWLGEVSHAERDRLRASLRSRASEFTQAFDREITHLYAAFQLDTAAFERDPAGTLAGAYTRAQTQSAADAIRDVFVVDAGSPEVELQRFDPAARTLAPLEWPASLASLRARARHARVVFNAPSGLAPFIPAAAIDAEALALVVPVTFVRRVGVGSGPVTADIRGTLRSVIIWLDADRLKRRLLEPLVARHFGADADSEYIVTIVSRATPSQVIYTTATAAAVTPETADISAAVFDLRIDELSRLIAGVTSELPADAAAVKDRVAITIVRKTGDGEGSRVMMAGVDTGAWQVLIRFRQGSLDALVARSRQRNLAIGLGVLGLLAASFVFVIGSAQRQQRLARQQIEFVAAVSHELRTPLAVIRSAGENLSDGVVADADQVKRYGALIGAEGRRLSDMVERVMEFAGINSSAPTHMRADVDVAGVMAAAVAAVAGEARERGITVAADCNGSLPAIVGDPDALRSAFQNVVGNALKYSTNGGTVDVRVEPAEDGVCIRVVDRGLGIDAADLPHVFKPFYRGRRAVDAQIRGTGVGLSVVRHVVDAHRGDILVESRVGEGTTVSMVLPAGQRVAPKREPQPPRDGGPVPPKRDPQPPRDGG